MSLPGIVTGLESEAAIVRKHAPSGFNHDLIACDGPGPDMARRAALALIDKDVGGLISFGYAGGIDRVARAGDLVIANEIRLGRDDTRPCEPIWSDALAAIFIRLGQVHRAPIAASEEIVATASEKMKLRYTTAAVATDMESFAVADVAAEAGLPFVTLRAVIDTHDQDLPPMAIEAAGPDGRLKLWNILWSLITNPGQIPKLGPLTRNSKQADRTLMRTCRKAGTGFALPDYRSVLIRQLRGTGPFRS